MRLFFAVILGLMFFSGRSAAQEDNVGTAASALQDVLSSLKQSVEKLAVDNDQLAARDSAVKEQVLQLQAQLKQSEAQGDFLNNTAAQLRGINPRRAQQMSRLEEENSDLDDRIQKNQDGIKSIQQFLGTRYQEDQKLILQLKGMTNAPPLPPQPPSPESQAMAHRQKERLKLMKMIDDSMRRQESLHEAILGFQKNTPMMPGAGALARQQFLKVQIKDLELQMAADPLEKPEFREQTSRIQSNRAFWDDAQLGQLGLELKALEKNYLQLKDVMGQMGKKSQAVRVTISQHVEEEKLDNSINDLNSQGVGLRNDLDELRSQMVDLDKRKSHLETMVQHLP